MNNGSHSRPAGLHRSLSASGNLERGGGLTGGEKKQLAAQRASCLPTSMVKMPRLLE
jgi:hypothetical protein